ncbi:MAG: hypothetical protein EBU35_13895 [Marivivens sp.]|nr:hypothetical protein [Marivivens sp.]
MTVRRKSNRPKSNMGDVITGFGIAGGAGAVGGYVAGKLHKRVTSKAKKLTEGLAKGGTKMILKDALGANLTSQESYLLKKKKKKK